MSIFVGRIVRNWYSGVRLQILLISDSTINFYWGGIVCFDPDYLDIRLVDQGLNSLPGI